MEANINLPKRDLVKATLILISLLLFPSALHAETIKGVDIERLLLAIGRAENSRSNPYGIMAKYKHTTPKQACLNTIRHGLAKWNEKGDFPAFLGKTYAPLNAGNDPKHLNKNWVKNVNWFYKRGGLK